METILITGAGGMLATALKKALTPQYDVRFLSRKKTNNATYLWRIEEDYIDENSLKDVRHIIHLAGASIGTGRWTKRRKQEIIDSRVRSARLIHAALKKNGQRIDSFISTSAVGYYGTATTDKIYTENDPAGNDFLSAVCQKWEQTAHAFNELSERVILLRLGVIFSKEGGILQQMYQPARLGLSAVLGSGKQYIPWIDIDDAAHMIQHILTNKQIQGIYNAVAPTALNNRQLTHILAKVLGKRVLLPAMPQWIIRLIFGEMALLLLQGSRVSCQKIKDTGFTFTYEHFEDTLKKIYCPYVQ